MPPKDLYKNEVVVQTKRPSQPSSFPEKKPTNKQTKPVIMQTQVENISHFSFPLAIFVLEAEEQKNQILKLKLQLEFE